MICSSTALQFSHVGIVFQKDSFTGAMHCKKVGQSSIAALLRAAISLHNVCEYMEEYFVRSSRNSRGAGRFNICFKFWRTFFSFFLHLSCCNFRTSPMFPFSICQLPTQHNPHTYTLLRVGTSSILSKQLLVTVLVLLVLMETTLNLIDFLTCRHHGPSMKVSIPPCGISQCSSFMRSACHSCAVLSLFSASVRRRMII